MSKIDQQVAIKIGERYMAMTYCHFLVATDLPLINAYHQSTTEGPRLSQEALKALNLLCVGHHGVSMGWWDIKKSFKTRFETTFPAGMSIDERGLGWEAYRLIFQHQSEVLDFLQFANKDLGTLTAPEAWKIANQAVLRADKQGWSVELPGIEQDSTHVIYSARNDAFLSQTGQWEGLGNARLFARHDLAMGMVKRKGWQEDCTVCEVALHIQPLSPHANMGPKMHRAMSTHVRQDMEESTPPASPSPKAPRL